MKTRVFIILVFFLGSAILVVPRGLAVKKRNLGFRQGSNRGPIGERYAHSGRDDVVQVSGYGNGLRDAEGWYWMPDRPNQDYPAPSGMPDFDQYQFGSDSAALCGPTSAADCLWWSNANVGFDPRDFIDVLSWYFHTEPCSLGSHADSIRAGLDLYFYDFGFFLEADAFWMPDFYKVEDMLKAGQDVILCLGYWWSVDQHSWYRDGGHFVTIAGVHSESLKVAFSDPGWDRAESGEPGRVRPPHNPHPEDDTLHNDPAYVSHDAHECIIDPMISDPGSRYWHIADYWPTTTGRGRSGLNLPQEYSAYTKSAPKNDSLFWRTAVEVAVTICAEDQRNGMYYISEPDHWYHPPIKVLPNQIRTIKLMLHSIGCQDLDYIVSCDHPCIQVSAVGSLAPKDSVEINVFLDGTGACNGTLIVGNVVITTNEAGGHVDSLGIHAVVAEDYYECPRDPETVDTLENSQLKLYVNAACQQWIHDIGWDYPTDTTHEVFFQGGTIVATTDAGDTLVGRFMGDNDLRAGAQDRLYKEQCEPDWEPHFWILFTKEIYIEASHLLPPNHFKWFWWEVAKQVKFFKDTAPLDYQRIVIKYVKVKRQDPPGWWPDLAPFTDHEDTYIGFAMDIDAPYDSSGGPEEWVGDENACNHAGYDAANGIAYVSGFGRTGEHPEYNHYHAGIALAEVDGVPTAAPYGSYNIKNNFYLYPQSPWGWLDGELYQLASTWGPNIQHPDSIVDRTIVMTAKHIPAGTDANAKAEFTIIEALAPTGLAELQELIDTARTVVARERAHGLPAACGDVNGDFVVNVGDIVYLVCYLYKGGPAPPCPIARGDVNNDGVINVGDVVYLVSFLYKADREPDCPGIWYW